MKHVALALALFCALSACSTSTTSTMARTTTTVAHEAFDVEVSAQECNSARCDIDFVVRAKAGFHVNADYPHRFVKDEDKGVDVADVKAASSTEHEKKLTATYARTASAATLIRGRLFLSVCTDDRCLIEKVPISLDVPAPG